MRRARAVLVGVLATMSLLAGSVPDAAAVDTVEPGTSLWVRRVGYAGRSVATTPDGATVFMVDAGGLAIAWTAETGTRIWKDRYEGPYGTIFDDVAVSPDGSMAVAVGTVYGLVSGDYVIVAYDAATGEVLWDATYTGAGNPDWVDDAALSVAIASSGDVVVTGSSPGSATFDMATVAYDGTTGEELWAKRFDDGADDQGYGVAVSPDGSTAFATGVGSDGITNYYATIAYDMANGDVRWTKRYPGKGSGYATDVAVAPDGTTVFVTGVAGTTGSDFATVAYDAITGSKQWASRWDDPDGGGDLASGIAVDPAGDGVYVTGPSERGFATVSYDAATGGQRWARIVNLGGWAFDIAVSPDGTGVAVAGRVGNASAAADYMTLAYDLDGTKRWATRYDGTAHNQDFPLAITIGTGDRVFVTGMSRGLDQDRAATIAYVL